MATRSAAARRSNKVPSFNPNDASFPPGFHVEAFSDPTYGPEGMWTQVEHITPKVAEFYLTLNTNNRKIREKKLALLVKDMLNDAYAQHHQGIAFDTQGVLLDGQHTLCAIVQSKKPQWILVTRGLQSESQRVMDIGAVRLASDFLEGGNSIPRVAASRVLLAVRNLEYKITPGSLSQALERISNSDLARFFDEEPEVQDNMIALWPAVSRASNFLPVGPSPVLAASIIYPRIAEAYMEGLATGALPEKSPLLAFRNASFQRTNKAYLRPRAQGTYHTLRSFEMQSRNAKISKAMFDGVSAEVKVPQF